jgi:hypothetical protein
MDHLTVTDCDRGEKHFHRKVFAIQPAMYPLKRLLPFSSAVRIISSAFSRTIYHQADTQEKGDGCTDKNWALSVARIMCTVA